MTSRPDKAAFPLPRRPRERRDRWPLARIITVAVGLLALFSVAAIVVGVFALTHLSTARGRVVDRIDPALQASLRLDAALVDQETGVRGYAISAQRDFLDPYTAGQTAERDATAALTPLLDDRPGELADLRQITALAEAWRTGYAQPAISAVNAGGAPGANLDVGKAAFDRVRAAVTDLQGDLNRARADAAATLHSSAAALNTACIGIAVVLVLIVLTLAFSLRAAAIRPLTKLTAEVRTVADGDFSHEVVPSGPREVHSLGVDVNLMRQRILRELSALDARTQDLQRSNAELEQFAYVASHDLQEPLRKVASFCRLLQRRYSGQLDERADQYIEFAVDGAKRMQGLINDLLAFSRVGRVAREPVPVSCATVLEQAEKNLAAAIEQTGATIDAGELPTVPAEAPLLTAVFQNLLGNALKFHGEDPPHITVRAERDGDLWRFSCRDNGIGIDPGYAERIFVIFQRLHGKSDYPGTGIGLALCRKIIEHHGGTIWLDTGTERGACFRFTLPVLPEEKEDHARPDPA
ncbi:HAMP domain-containing protein [Amycolatopsis acidicola]|uniref:histidine kinase n=1 Tax=Amycolatopsis acidicola TaxID=2596893 RepID=A0A5N0UQT5_9PSEU|nr:sensor histidine kinase [Amycolatopsis acidicola]KAA9149727.1 HAMP domain-containing protein [Amycolatopsis acidicola]